MAQFKPIRPPRHCSRLGQYCTFMNAYAHLLAGAWADLLPRLCAQHRRYSSDVDPIAAMGPEHRQGTCRQPR